MDAYAYRTFLHQKNNDNGSEEVWYTVELVYEEDGISHRREQGPTGETLEDLIGDIAMMLEAVTKPALPIDRWQEQLKKET